MPGQKTESQMTLNSQKSMTEIRNPPWWNRRTRLERGLLVLSFFTLIAIVALALALGIIVRNFPSPSKFPNESEWKNDSRYCLTPGCVLAAASILKNLDQTVDPCDDFYSFACGGFINSTFIPDDKSSINQFVMISDELKNKLRILVEEPIEKGEPPAFQMVKTLYSSCMNKTRIEELGLNVLRDIINELGGWPVVTANWTEDNFVWYETIYKFRKMGFSVDYMIDFSVSVDLKNSTNRIIDFDQPTLGMARKYLIKGLNDSEVQAYYKFMVDVAVALGAQRNLAEEELREALEFEIKLAEISLPSEERRNASKLYNKMTLGELSVDHPSIPWLDYVNTLMAPFHTFTLEEPVVIDVPSFIYNFTDLLEIVPNRTISNYLIWRSVAATVNYLTEDMRKIQLEFSKKITGQAVDRPRWQECMGVVSSSLPNAIGALYVRRFFKEDAKLAALMMVQDIKSEFDKMLDEIDWMDDVTKMRAREKSKAIKSHIAYPDELLNNTALNDLYNGLELNQEYYLKCIMSLNVFGTNYAFKKLREPVDKNDWVTHGRAAVVNAFYSPLENSIQFPAGILQGVFFSNDRPKYLNYGAIGYVIGHEITHGFDDTGRQFDLDGNLVDWWEPATDQNFRDRAKCIIEQYGNYTVPEIGLNLNGMLTQGENIADNGGIKQAYRAYKKWVAVHGEEKKLPGLDYVPSQLFWMKAANVWCHKERPESLKLSVLSDAHSPAKYRVNVPMGNMKEFSRDWNCPPGCKMSPTETCSVW